MKIIQIIFIKALKNNTIMMQLPNLTMRIPIWS